MEPSAPRSIPPPPPKIPPPPPGKPAIPAPKAKEEKSAIHIAMKDVRKAFGPKHVLNGVNLDIPRGQSVVIIGGSGTGKSARTPILAVSANVLPQAVQEFRDAGMDAFVGKPLALSTLRKALAALLGNAAATPDAEDEGDDPLSAMRRDLGEEVFAQFVARFVTEGDPDGDADSARRPVAPAGPEPLDSSLICSTC